MTMSRLRECQIALAAAIQAPRRPPEGGLHGLGIDAPDVSRRLAIHRRNTCGACIAALRQTYPVVLAVVGPRCFDALASQYLAAYPSTDPDLNRYGDRFHRVLALAIARPQFTGLGYLPQLARLEWLWQLAYYLPDDGPFDHAGFAQALRGVPEKVVLTLGASVHLLDSQTPVHTIWAAHRHGDTHRTFPPGRERIVVWRQHNRRLAAVVCPRRYGLLDGVQRGLSLGALAATADALDRLPELLRCGWIGGYQVLS